MPYVDHSSAWLKGNCNKLIVSLQKQGLDAQDLVYRMQDGLDLEIGYLSVAAQESVTDAVKYLRTYNCFDTEGPEGAHQSGGNAKQLHGAKRSASASHSYRRQPSRHEDEDEWTEVRGRKPRSPEQKARGRSAASRSHARPARS
jgi:hypothetical protein